MIVCDSRILPKAPRHFFSKERDGSSNWKKEIAHPLTTLTRFLPHSQTEEGKEEGGQSPIPSPPQPSLPRQTSQAHRAVHPVAMLTAAAHFHLISAEEEALISQKHNKIAI